jgi:hypothetical protein
VARDYLAQIGGCCENDYSHARFGNQHGERAKLLRRIAPAYVPDSGDELHTAAGEMRMQRTRSALPVHLGLPRQTEAALADGSDRSIDHPAIAVATHHDSI